MSKKSKRASERAAAEQASHPELLGYLDVEEQGGARAEFRVDTLRKLVANILEYRGLLAWGLLLILLSTGAILVEPRLLGYTIDEAIVPKRWPLLKLLTLAFFVTEILRVGSVILNTWVFSLLGQKVMQDVRLRLFDHIERLPVSTFDKNPAGRLVTRLTNDVAAMAEMFSAGFVMIVGNILVVLGIMGGLLIMDVRLGLIAIAIFPVLIWSSVHFSRLLEVAYRDARSKLSALNAFLAENILGMRVVMLFNRQKKHRERFERINSWYAEAQFGTTKVYAMLQPTITWCSGISMALVIWYGGGAYYQGRLKVGLLFAFFSYTTAMFQPVRELVDKWNIFLSGMASAERIFSMLQWPTELGAAESAPAAEPVPGLRGHIVFENVWFAYEGENWILKDFSLEIRPGMRVGVVGHSGAGKTTLISLLMRFYDAQRGRILIDGKDIREYDKRALRASIGIIQQDVFLFSGTVEENLTLWRDREGRSDALGRALRELALDFDEKIELQERGTNLSMGQRQMLSFARALYAEPSIWILDEATANIDSESEKKVERALEHASQGKTSILIAHRLSTVRSADLILVLHKGALLERGRHAELMRLDGLYARLYRYQSASEEVEKLSAEHAAEVNSPGVVTEPELA